jgi:GNAT superfamily N-acetyltransferase
VGWLAAPLCRNPDAGSRLGGVGARSAPWVRVGWPRQRVPRWGGHSGSIQSGFVVSLPGGADHQTRPAADVEAIAGVHVRSWQIGHQADYPKHVVESVSVGERSQVWQKALRDPSAEKTVLIAEIDGVVVGFISSGPVRGAIDDAARTGEVYELFVDPASFGRGVGTALMERTLDRASRSSNARSIRFRRSHVPGVGWPVLTGPRSEPPLSREGPHPAWHRTPWPRRLD